MQRIWQCTWWPLTSITSKCPSRQIAEQVKNVQDTLGYHKIIVPKIPPGGRGAIASSKSIWGFSCFLGRLFGLDLIKPVSMSDCLCVHKFFLQISTKFCVQIEVDEWHTKVCYMMTQSKVKVKVTKVRNLLKWQISKSPSPPPVCMSSKE